MNFRPLVFSLLADALLQPRSQGLSSTRLALLHKLTSIFHASVLFLIMNFMNTIVKVTMDPLTTLIML